MLLALPLLLPAVAHTEVVPVSSPLAKVISLQFVPEVIHKDDADYTKNILQPLYAAEAKNVADAKAAQDAQTALEALQSQQAAEAVTYTTYTPTSSYTGSGDSIAYAQARVPAEQFACLYPLWQRESGWDPYAVNSSSGAAGIAQSLGHGTVILGDYASQIDWGLNYIQSRYGTPCNAWNFELNNGWY